MTRWHLWAAVGLSAFVAGLIVGARIAAHEPPPAQVEAKREVAKEATAAASAEAQVRIVTVAGPTVTRWRTAPAAPGCPEVREVTQEAGPVERIVQQATRSAMESKSKEAEHVRILQRAGEQPRFSLGALGGANASAMGGADRHLWAAVIGGVRLIGPVWVGGAVVGRAGGVDVGVGGWVTW